jgi:GT2 family glycosyltransferase
VIPTFGRERVLVETITHLLRQRPMAAEIVVVDQTPRHEGATEEALATWEMKGQIRWLRLPKPSIPHAMNRGLMEATQPIVLFVDDDIVPSERLVDAHWRNYSDDRIWAVVGQVRQPGQVPVDLPMRGTRSGIWADLDFPFNSRQRTTVWNCMAGNLSVRRDRAIAVGGFDENFVAVAYRFETEFARRLCRSGGIIQFDPAASINHLQAARGGTRTYANRLRSARPDHSIGEYYFALRQSPRGEALAYVAYQLLRRSCARYYLAHPWWLPVGVAGEIRGLLGAIRMTWQPQRLIESGLLHGKKVEKPVAIPGEFYDRKH